MAPASRPAATKAPRAIATTQSLSAFVKGICDIMRRSNCASALQYVPELTWILFLRILDAQETRDAERAEALGRPFTPALGEPYRWQDWAAPCDLASAARTPEDRHVGWKREALKPRVGELMAFINKDLLPHLHQLDVLPDGLPNLDATPKQRVIGRIMTAVERVRVDSETNLCDILDRVHEISIDHIDDRHCFTLSQVYEDLLLKMGEKNSDGGQFFTPREVVRAMVRTLAPQLGETVYDPCCGTGGFLAQAYESMRSQLGDAASATDIEQLKSQTFYGREKENLVLPIALANLVLHGIDQPRLWHGNTLSGAATYDALFDGAPATFDVILTNPPFGGKEGRDAQQHYAFETSATQVLFLQHILDEPAPPTDGRPGGRCGVVLDEGFLFRTNESAFVETKRKLLDECDLWCVVSPPAGLALFGWGPGFEVLDDAALPATLVGDWASRPGNEARQFPSFARLLALRGTAAADSDLSWTVDFAARRAAAREAMAPHLAEATRLQAQAVRLKDQLAVLRKARADDAAAAPVRQALTTCDRALREAQARAAAIDAATFDLKAVNAHARVERDERTPTQVLAAIQAHGAAVDMALARLQALLAADGAPMPL